MPTQPYHHGDLKAELIHKGLKLLVAEGYERFSIRKAAKLCGVSQTAPYRHFKNKDELISAITDHALDRFANELQAAVDMHPGDPQTQLTGIGIAYVRFFAANPEYLRLLFLSDTKLKARFTKCSKFETHTESFRILYETTARCVQESQEIPYSQEELILFSWGLVHGLSALIAAGELPNNETTLEKIEALIRKVVV